MQLLLDAEDANYVDLNNNDAINLNAKIEKKLRTDVKTILTFNFLNKNYLINLYRKLKLIFWCLCLLDLRPLAR